MPDKQGLYDPAYEHDACGVGFVARVSANGAGRAIALTRAGRDFLASLKYHVNPPIIWLSSMWRLNVVLLRRLSYLYIALKKVAVFRSDKS